MYNKNINKLFVELVLCLLISTLPVPITVLHLSEVRFCEKYDIIKT